MKDLTIFYEPQNNPNFSWPKENTDQCFLIFTVIRLSASYSLLWLPFNNNYLHLQLHMEGGEKDSF